MPHRPGHTGQTAPGTGQFQPTGREGSGPGILEKIMAMLQGMAPGGQEPSTMTASDLHQVFAPSVDEAPSLEHEVRTPDLTRPRVSGLQPELQGQETGDAGTGALLESIAAILENPEFLAMQTEGPIPHAFEAGRQLDIQRNEPERLLRQLLDRYGARLQ